MKVKNADDIRWDLRPLYKSLNDKNIWKDLELAEEYGRQLEKLRGKLAENMPKAIRLHTKIYEITSGIFLYLYLMGTHDLENTEVKKLEGTIYERVALINEATAFLFGEMSGIDDAKYKKIYRSSPVARRSKPHIDKIIESSEFLLTDEEEGLLYRLAPFIEDSVLATCSNTTSAASAFIVIDKSLTAAKADCVMGAEAGADFTACTLALIHLRFAFIVHIHFTCTATRTHTYIFNCAAKACYFVSFKMVNGNHNICIHYSPANAGNFTVFTAVYRYINVVRSADTVSDNILAAG